MVTRETDCNLVSDVCIIVSFRSVNDVMRKCPLNWTALH
jgi:hypothetical protein